MTLYPSILDGWNSKNEEKVKSSKDTGISVVLGASGSVAAVKVPEIVQLLVNAGIRVNVILTEAAHFFQKVDYRGKTPLAHLKSLQNIMAHDGSPMVKVYRDEDEWNNYNKLGDEVRHIELAKGNQALIIAPLSANTLSKMALGTSSGLLTSVVRAWYYDLDKELKIVDSKVKSRPLIVAPAMNTYMWHQKVTSEHIEILKKRGVVVVDPVSKLLACGDVGKGAMETPEKIVSAVLKALFDKCDILTY
eukprot:CAMPEP_0167743262 /NCGR_PEP_ID=MMETSP0110_2-20121227/1915_1 /TAXON_ID=629695 /ORGANISM="Gymnochlora sp., Strain CCMP2014" /LENGTH=247 /DNA_ID=CAMNT_0007627607 /DNA_START=84 /DNA_END=827 /DNA_ORIENTATION=+